MKKQPLGQPPGIHRLFIDDVRRPGVSRAIRDEIAGIRGFYLDDEQIARLDRYGPVRRFLMTGWWLLKSLLQRLSPTRRLVLFLALALVVFFPDLSFRFDQVSFKFTLWPLSLAALLALLMLELRDKLVARDEIEVARAVQLSLLPRDHPAFGGWTMWSATAPANDVGGDLVDYVPLPGRRLGVVLGDVAGKGMGAALLCAKLQATLRALAPGAHTLDELGRKVNGILHRDGLDNRFATVFYAEIAEDSGRVRYLNAGHNPALVVRLDRIDRLPASSCPLGMIADAAYGEGVADLEVGDCLVVYSDGISETVSPSGDEFGEERVVELVRRHRDASPRAIASALLEAASSFGGASPPLDDRSVVVVKR